MKIKVFFLAFAFTFFFSAQSFSQTPLMDRLCHTWVLQAMDDGTGKKNVDDAQRDFRLIFNKDMTCKQGLQPDGLISSSWKLDEPNMMITIVDVATQKTFSLKILFIQTYFFVCELHF